MNTNVDKNKRDRLANFLYSYWENNKEKRESSFNYIRKHIKDQIKSIELTSEDTIVHLQDGRKFYWNPNSYDSLNGFIRIGNWEPESVHILEKLIKDGDCVVDVGANFGWYTTLFANYTGSKGKVHSFEPLKHMNNELISNVNLNEYQNVTINELGLGEANSLKKFYYPKTRGSMFSSLKKHSKNNDYIEYTCRFITLDSYIKDNNINCIDLIKLDVEGAELLVLNGAKNLLSSKKAPILTLEVSQSLSSSFNYTPKYLEDFLKQYNYLLFTISKELKLKPVSSLEGLETLNIFCLQKRHIDYYKDLFEQSKEIKESINS
ncbi:FkbM family methyltransferase [Bacillus toyonensis]|uniref:FkbM family methyltransferase n=1 Tax=Bacillus toyonensis TaxID=155322 RepID=UPI000BEC7631|nr:FkbM family methyltransferase [Bacillus toyonensis]PEC08072.1 hypothetical protein CON55_26000 [Bacillus toyonensis]